MRRLHSPAHIAALCVLAAVTASAHALHAGESALIGVAAIDERSPAENELRALIEESISLTLEHAGFETVALAPASAPRLLRSAADAGIEPIDYVDDDTPPPPAAPQPDAPAEPGPSEPSPPANPTARPRRSQSASSPPARHSRCPVR